MSRGKMACTPAAIQYYLAMASNVLGYFQDVPRWFGQFALALGLQGTVDPAQLGEVLSRVASRPGVSVLGFDLTAAGPGSFHAAVSVASGDVRRDLLAAEEIASRFAREFIESELTSRAGKGGHQVVSAECLGIEVREFYGRRKDSQVHRHHFWLNWVRRPDGTEATIHSRHFHSLIFPSDVIFNAVMRAELENRGFRTRDSELVWSFELEGVPKGLVNEHSSGRAEIEQELSRRGLSSRRAADIVNQEQRRTKENLPLSALQPDWDRRALRWNFRAEDLPRQEPAQHDLHAIAQRAAERCRRERLHSPSPARRPDRPLESRDRERARPPREFANHSPVADPEQDHSSRHRLAGSKAEGEHRASRSSQVLVKRSGFRPERRLEDDLEQDRRLSRIEQTIAAIRETRHELRSLPAAVAARLELLRAGHVSRSKVEEALSLAKKSFAVSRGDEVFRAGVKALQQSGRRVICLGKDRDDASKTATNLRVDEQFTLYQALAKMDTSILKEAARNLCLRSLRRHLDLGALAYNAARQFDPWKRYQPKHRAVFNKAVPFEPRLKFDENTVLVLSGVGRVGARALSELLDRAAAAGATVIIRDDRSQRAETLRKLSERTHAPEPEADRQYSQELEM